jgi:transposase-like protein
VIDMTQLILMISDLKQRTKKLKPIGVFYKSKNGKNNRDKNDNKSKTLRKLSQIPDKFCECRCGTLLKDPSKRFVIGHNRKIWKGGRTKENGYWLILKPEHHEADEDGHVRENPTVYEEYHKCCLLSWTHIHHKNGNKLDNRPKNLEPTTVEKHPTLHKKDFGQLCVCGSRYVNRTSIKNGKQGFQCMQCKRCWSILVSDLARMIEEYRSGIRESIKAPLRKSFGQVCKCGSEHVVSDGKNNNKQRFQCMTFKKNWYIPIQNLDLRHGWD